jgi:hypothetical protein
MGIQSESFGLREIFLPVTIFSSQAIFLPQFTQFSSNNSYFSYFSKLL